METEVQKLFKQGQQAFIDGKSWETLRGMNAAVFRGWDDECKSTRQGYTNMHWNLPHGYKTSSDLRTMFT